MESQPLVLEMNASGYIGDALPRVRSLWAPALPTVAGVFTLYARYSLELNPSQICAVRGGYL
jgi:hypothetical protein